MPNGRQLFQVNRGLPETENVKRWLQLLSEQIRVLRLGLRLVRKELDVSRRAGGGSPRELPFLATFPSGEKLEPVQAWLRLLSRQIEEVELDVRHLHRSAP